AAAFKACNVRHLGILEHKRATNKSSLECVSVSQRTRTEVPRNVRTDCPIAGGFRGKTSWSLLSSGIFMFMAIYE
ncbi:Uncharacterized protein DAT39_011367, partial [Clarias magur]